MSPQPSFDIIVAIGDPGTNVVGSFNYLRDLPSGARWLDGDRLAYRCGWTFLQWQGELVARVTFRRTSDYIAGLPITRVEDRFMAEGQRAFDGTPGTGQQTAPPAACAGLYPEIDYPPLAGDAGPRPIIAFHDLTSGELLETRSYADQDEPGSEFVIVETTPALTIVAFYESGQPVAAAYYEVLRPDLIVKRTNADPTTPPPPGTATGTGTITLNDGRVVTVTLGVPV